MNKTKIKRGTPFAWQDKRILRRIQSSFDGADQRNLLLLFLTITWMESDFVDKDIKYYRNVLKKYSGLSKKVISDGLRKLEEIEVLSIRQLRDKGVFSGMEIEILPETTETEKSPHGKFTEGRFTDVRKTDVRKMTTIEENTKQKKVLNRINNTTNVVLENQENEIDENSQISEVVEKEKKVPQKKEKGKRREDIDMILEWIKQELGCTGFKENQKQQRMAGMQLANLAKKITPEEFGVRFNALMNDDFHSRNMGSLWYIYRQVKGYVPKKQVSSNIPEFD